MKNTVQVSTDMFEVRDRNDYWRDVTRPAFETIIQKDDHDRVFYGEVTATQIGEFVIGETKFNAQHYVRDQKIISSFGLDSYIFQIVTAGSLTGDFNGVCSQAFLGDICILDMAQTFESKVSEGERITIVLPRAPMQRSGLAGNIHGRVLLAEDPLTKFMIDFASSLRKVASHLNGSQLSSLQNSMIDMFSMALSGKEFNHAESLAVAPLTRQSIIDYIDSNIESINLTTEAILQKFRVSRSHLYRLFADNGGVATIIRNKRLTLAYQRLVNSNERKIHLADLAYKAGFKDYNSFSRLFQERFGQKPGDVRAEVREINFLTNSDQGIVEYFKSVASRG